MYFTFYFKNYTHAIQDHSSFESRFNYPKCMTDSIFISQTGCGNIYSASCSPVEHGAAVHNTTPRCTSKQLKLLLQQQNCAQWPAQCLYPESANTRRTRDFWMHLHSASASPQTCEWLHLQRVTLIIIINCHLCIALVPLAVQCSKAFYTFTKLLCKLKKGCF